MKLHKSICAMALLLVPFACDQTDDVSQMKRADDSAVFMDLPADAHARSARSSKYAVYSAEYLTSAESGQIGRTVFFKNVGNKQLSSDFVPGLSLDGTDEVSYYVDQKRPSEDLSAGATSAAISRAMSTWDQLTCSGLGMYQVPSDRKTTTGFISEILGYKGSLNYVADVVHAGWMSGSFFDVLAPDGSTFILGVTFTIIFTDDLGNPTDIDNNGKLDVAWREIYYNDAFSWADGRHYDVETIALHEAGHGLSQAHFGQAFLDAGSGALHFSPRAVMNAAYSGIQTAITETDNAGHCSNWSEWPNK